MPDRVIFWFRRDLRLADHPALAAAAAAGEVLGCFVVDPALVGPSGAPRLRFLADSLADLDRSMGGRLALVAGEPVAELKRLAATVGAGQVFATADFGPYGHHRDRAVAAALGVHGITVTYLDSPYAVVPGTVHTNAGKPFQVFTPFHRAWAAAGWADPIGVPRVTWVKPPSGTGGCDPGALLARYARPAPTAPESPVERAGTGDGRQLSLDLTAGPGGDQPKAGVLSAAIDLSADQAASGPGGGKNGLGEKNGLGADGWAAGEEAAHRRLVAFLGGAVDDYGTERDHPAVDGTTGLSPYLRWGTLHPRQVLAELGDAAGPATVAKELAWREFYADVLWHRPDSARHELQDRMTRLRYDHGARADERFEAWAWGRTGYPIVDAGMRQLLATGWMHNRVRMIVASFLAKDLHLDWRRGARWFMAHLVDGDLASNQHNWQWVAGTGTDAAPYFRVFNPVSQGEKFDPGGRYVRTWVPGLAGVPDRFVHHPWDAPGGPPAGYPGPIVDHGTERAEALARFEALKANSA